MRWRRRAVPDQVTNLALERGERRAAWALTAQGQPVVVTDRGLRLPEVGLLGWDRIERVSFEAGVLTVRELVEVQGTGPRHTVTLDLTGQTDLPEVLRARVTASIAWSSHERLHPTGGVRIVGRRRPDQDALVWQLVFDQGTDLADLVVREQAEAHLLAARRTIG